MKVGDLTNLIQHIISYRGISCEDEISVIDQDGVERVVCKIVPTDGKLEIHVVVADKL